MNKVLKIFKVLGGVLQSNLAKKQKLMYFFRLRTQITNWLPLYIVYSSLFLDLLEIFIRKLKLNHLLYGWQLQTVFKDGVRLFHPITTRFAGIAERQDENYLKDFKSLFNASLVLETGDVVIDIGAHVGSFAIPLAKRFGVRVLAYEPDQGNVQCILNGIKANHFDAQQFKVMQAAVYSKDGEVEFSVGDTPTTGSLSSTGFFLQNKKNKKVLVKATTISSIFKDNQITRCKVLKIDCEGSEHCIFQHIDWEIFNQVEYLLIEVHPVPGFSCEDFISKLTLKFDVKYQKTKSGKGGSFDQMYEVYAKNLTSSIPEFSYKGVA